MRYRDTYAEISISSIQNNVSKIIQKYSSYAYYFGVVKADCYGHYDVIKAVIDGGCNYLAVALLEEALEIRKQFPKIPILCLGVVPTSFLSICEENNITITVSSYEYAKMMPSLSSLKAHIKINSGMNRLGISSKEELKQTIQLLKNKVQVEGIYTHIYHASDLKDTECQFQKYEEILKDIDKSSIPIFHVAASEALIHYKPLDFVNGCRLGIIMYGFTDDKKLDLESTFSLYSKIIQIQHLKPGDKVGYDGIYIAEKEEDIGVACIGYADGVLRKNTGRNVYIHDKVYPIVGNICMDMLFVKIDDTIKVGDVVVILKDNEHIKQVAQYTNTIPYEVLCSISKRVPRIYTSDTK